MHEDSEYRENDEIVIDLREVFGILKKKIKTILGITAVFLAVAGSYAFFWPKTYESVALIRTDMKNQGYFTARSTVEPVMVKFAEKDDKGNLPRYENFVKNIKLTQPRNSEFLTVTVNAKEPQLAQDMNKMLIDGAIDRYMGKKSERLNLQIKFAEKELTKVRKELAEAEQDLRNSRTRASGMEYDVIFGKVSNGNSKVTDLNTRLLDLQMKKEDLKNDIEIIDEPTFDEKPVSPKKARTLAIALVLGLICGSMYVVVKEKM